MKTFEKLAAEHKTPSKPPKLKRDIDLFETYHNWKTWEKDVLSGKTSVDLSGSSFSQSVERQFNVLGRVVRDVISKVNSNNDELTKSIQMLEFEKNKLKAEVGKGDTASIHSDYESSIIWLTLSALSECSISLEKQ